MLSIAISNKLFSKKLYCTSSKKDVSSFSFDFYIGKVEILKDGLLIAATDGRNYLIYSDSEELYFDRKYNGVRRDRLVSKKGESVIEIERNYKHKKGFFFNNYSKYIDRRSDTIVLTSYEQWKFFSPIKVVAYTEEDSDLDMVVIFLLLAWLRYEYETHDSIW